uniref:Uncharacterized protein n=1 Tax=Alexandrium monilatum TaxID=311494 RepID=A0A7S4QIR6_9DINO
MAEAPEVVKTEDPARDGTPPEAPAIGCNVHLLAKEMLDRVPADPDYVRRSLLHREGHVGRREDDDRIRLDDCSNSGEETGRPRPEMLSDSDEDSLERGDSGREHVLRSLLRRASDPEDSSEDGSLRWRGDGTPSNQVEQQSIAEAVRQLAQRYEGPREFWTESTLPTITKDSLPSAWATRDQLPTMTAESLPAFNHARERETPHAISSSSDEDTGRSSQDDTMERRRLRSKQFVTRFRNLHASKESLPTIMSESCENSEIGSQAAGSRCPSQFGSRPVSRTCTRDSLPDFEPSVNVFKTRTTTKDSLPPIGDEEDTESEDKSSEDGQDEDSAHAKDLECEAPHAGPQTDAIKQSSEDASEVLTLAQKQLEALRAEMSRLRRDNTNLRQENRLLLSLAANGDVLSSLAGVANNPKGSAAGCRQGPGHAAKPPEPPGTEAPQPELEGDGGPAEAVEAPQPMSSKERWLKRRQERRLRRNSATDGKISYGRWLVEQHEQVIQIGGRHQSGSTDDGSVVPRALGPDSSRGSVFTD